MRHTGIRKAVAIITTLILSTSSLAMAQVKAPFMEDYPFVYEGQVGGLDAWSLPDDEDLWLVLPDGSTVVAGLVFSGRGNDIGSTLLGIEPVDAIESLDMMVGRIDQGFRNAPITEQQAPVPDDAFDGMQALEDAMLRAGPDLNALSDQERDGLLADLVESLDQASSPEEFQERLLDWHEMVTGGVEGTDDPAEGDELAFQDITPDRTRMILDAIERAEARDPSSEDATPGEGDILTDDVALMNDLAESSMWFGIGEASARPVYMVYDPACPFCARAIQNLESRAASGDIQLRIILAPAISEQSLGVAAAILDSESPAETLLWNARQITQSGASALEAVDPAAIDPDLLRGVAINLDVLQEHGVPGVPFFAWDDGGPRFFAGVPKEDHDFGTTD